MVHPSIRIIREEHAALATLMNAFEKALLSGPGDQPEVFFDGMRAMLFYVDEFPEQLHHPKESNLLFPRVARLAPETMETIVLLEKDHATSESAVRELQHLLLAWELMGESRREAFVETARHYIRFYLAHMQMEENVIFPAALRVLSDEDWRELDAAFATNCDPLTGQYKRNPAFDRLFARILMHSPGAVSGST
ncbi:hemerythrin domain-containing protein [Rhodoferax sp. PAMC 29310]|uniref:hemerythrin domain-containing protein n=1 Tax=Rhodoferax sp. PAMC 29310 TaxID=2822760 RepID=UPI001B32F086|nr:hemerythrin domain-containing protein [Rhodoferax sp. PAMC 29310]